MDKLTKQECKVAYLTAMGYVQKEIGEKLFISQGTVHSHQKNIRKKTGARNTADVTRMYILAYPKQFVLAMALAFVQLFASIDVDTEMQRTRTNRTHRVAKRVRARRLRKDFLIVG